MLEIAKTTMTILRRGREGELPVLVDLDVDELPCPWCSHPTSEHDPRCPGCGRRFG